MGRDSDTARRRLPGGRAGPSQNLGSAFRVPPKKGKEEKLADRGYVARHDPFDHFVSRQRVLTVHQRECGQSPIDAVHAQVFGKVVAEFIAVLFVGGSQSASAQPREREEGETDLVEGLDVRDVQV